MTISTPHETVAGRFNLLLVSNKDATTGESSVFVTSQYRKTTRRRITLLCCCIAFSVCIATFILKRDEVMIMNQWNDNIIKEVHQNEKVTTEFTTVIKEMNEKLYAAKQDLLRQLYVDYGTPYFDQMFREEVDNVDATSSDELPPLRMIFQPTNGTSYQRLKQRVMIKIIQGALLEIRKKSYFTSNDNETTTEQQQEQFEKVSFVWANAGHSVAAGHGNLYDETYTSIIKQSLQSTMASIFNIDFIVRQYAMGSTKSGPEIALCLKEIFGQDVDILLWHYALTDNRDVSLMYLFLYRSGFISSHPINILFEVSKPERYEIIESLQQINHLPILSMDTNVLADVLNHVPDSFGLLEEQIMQLPKFVRNFRCQKQIEDGDPYCKTEKFNLTVCPKRLYQTNWHPGWKWNAVLGYLATLSLIQVFEDALQTLVDIDDPFRFIEDMNELQESYVTKFHQSEPSEQYLQPFVSTKTESIVAKQVNVSLLAKGHSFCHPGLLPSEIRNKGILTETLMDETADSSAFDKGIEFKEAMNNVNHEETSLRLVYQEYERYRIRQSNSLEQDRIACPYETFMDYKDSFFLNHEEGWKGLMLPNDAELKEYGIPLNDSYPKDNNQRHTFQGYIMICFLTLCPYGICPTHLLKVREAFQNQQVLLQVNNISVTELVPFKTCDLLAHNESMIWPLHAITGKYNIQARVLQDDSYLQISSIITW